jgi:hypothetical protein
MKYVAIFHANLNYAYLTPPYYERTIRASYERIIDTFRDKCPRARYVFEASGYTIDQIAKLTPDVLEKLYDAHREYDTAQTKEDARRKIHAIYEEYVRRGATRITTPPWFR